MVRALGLRLALYELRAIADALEKLTRAGIRTDNIIVGQHRVFVTQEQPPPGADQRDTAQWVVTGIERVGHPARGPIARDDPGPF